MSFAIRFCPQGVGVRLANDGLRSSPEIMRVGVSGTPRAQVLLPLRARSPASKAPTGSAQKRNHPPFAIRFCPQGVGVRLADDGARSGPEIMRVGVSGTPRAHVLLPLRARSPASKAPTGSAQKRKPTSQRDLRHPDGSVGANLLASP